MRRIKALLGATLVAVLATLALVAAPALADEYQYTVRVFPGNRGSLDDDPVVMMVSKGGSVDLYEIATPKVKDDRYVHTGYRLSGTDVLLGNGRVNGIAEDMDFVAAYGVEADTVPYTLRFVEYQTGRQLAEPRTYHGKVGDKPVAAYEYVEGYRPLYLSITGTLRADGQNEWTFEYVKLAEGETVDTTTTNTGTTVVTTTTTTPGTTTTTTTGEPQATGTQDTDANATTAEGTGTEEGTAENTQTTGTQGEDEAPQTQEILDLDTPLAGPDGSSGNAGAAAAQGSPFGPATIAGIGLALAALIALVLFLLRRKRGAGADESSS